MATERAIDLRTGVVTERTFTPGPQRVPQSVTPLQMRRALRAAGLKAGIDAYLASLGEEAQEAMEYAVEIRHDDPLVNAAATALGKSQEELDAIFQLAATMSIPVAP